MGIEPAQLNIKYQSTTINVNNLANNQYGTNLLCILMCNHTALFFPAGGEWVKLDGFAVEPFNRSTPGRFKTFPGYD